MNYRNVDVAIIGAGIAGIATAYYLSVEHHKKVLLIDHRQPMSFTSAHSGDNYRNWWPHPTMTAFTNYSIDLMERLALESSNVFQMTRRGYVLATRDRDIDAFIEDLQAGYVDSTENVRTHNSANAYEPPTLEDWQSAPDGVDVLTHSALIQETYPSLSPSVSNVVHIRRGGDISGQQLGQYMLEMARAAGAKRLAGEVSGIEHDGNYALDVRTADGVVAISTEAIVNAAGPFANRVAKMLDVELPVSSLFQQKLAFDDEKSAIPRTLPFSLDLDERKLDWSDEEREMLADDNELGWLTGTVPGGTHCRPEGGDRGTWVKLGWAYNRNISEPRDELANDPHYDPQFPEIVMRGAATLHPALKVYLDDFPTRFTHYGGYYTMTDENWPLVGPMGADGAYMVTALSGFGSMAACAAGSICADLITGRPPPGFAADLGLERYRNTRLMADLANLPSRGVV